MIAGGRNWRPAEARFSGDEAANWPPPQKFVKPFLGAAGGGPFFLPTTCSGASEFITDFLLMAEFRHFAPSIAKVGPEGKHLRHWLGFSGTASVSIIH
ncbi:hypothetical protein [uncultured Mameliella sp.]|uniref:hypothetical protein n=1 Tax=uncultured Mameliella sp. TaxID=1447087 RepID=UPI0026071263|nr:hypothetical protein [uncultured Mameliella sp.]